MRSNFEAQLRLLQQKMTEMGAYCEHIIALAAKSLLEGNTETAWEAKKQERLIDQLEREIEGICLKLILHEQPVARDLRAISAALKMVTDLERIGDQAAVIAEITPLLHGRTGEACREIRTMAEGAIRMVTDSVDAYVKQDLALVQAVSDADDAIDEAFARTKKALIRMIADNPDDGEYALNLLLIAKYLERIADHAVNVAEWVEFSVTGVLKES